jgi:hypothetical protein
MSNIKLRDIEANPELRKNQENLKVILNHAPAKDWLKVHPFAKGVTYIPIGRVEMLLDTLFIEWKVEVINYSQLFNSVSCQVRLHYINPVSGSWAFHDGLGAVGVQTDKGAKASDLTAVKQDAVMKALPAAKSYAIKDAAEHIGKIFGRDLNRSEELVFNSTRTSDEEKLDEIKTLLMEKEHLIPEQELINLERVVKNEEKASYNKALKYLKTVA